MKLRAGPDDRLYEFGAFVFDPVVGRLYRHGQERPVTPKALKVLEVLVERAGRPVEKGEIFQHVWPETFVEENNLARNVSMLRKVLRDDESPECIVTRAGRGYEFTAPVAHLSRAELHARAPFVAPVVQEPTHTEPTPAASSDAPPDLSVPELLTMVVPPAPSRSRYVSFALGVALIGAIGVGGWVSRHDAPSESGLTASAALRLRPLTSTGRFEADPSWSPDGRTIAYASDRSGTFDLWVAPASGGPATQLTSDRARDSQPAWSPDGRLIAFRSERDGGGIFVVPAFGGPIRQVIGFGFRPRWSPDGATMLFSHGPYGAPQHPYVVDLAKGSSWRVRPEFASDSQRVYSAWHPSGRISLYHGDRTHGGRFLTASQDGRQVTSAVAASVKAGLRSSGVRLGDFVWAPTGDALYFEGRTGDTRNIWRVRVDPDTLEWIAGPDRVTLGVGAETHLALSPDGRHLAFGAKFERTRGWRIPFDAEAGRITGPGAPITPAGTDSQIVDVSSDGSQLAYQTTRHGRDELWIRSLDQGDDRLRRVEADGGILQPRWSRDGTQLAYFRPAGDSRLEAAAVVLLGAGGGGDRVLSASPPPTNVFDWSLDGDSFLVGCRPGTNTAICILPLDSPNPHARLRVLAADEALNLFQARGSPDGRWVSFVATRGVSGRTKVLTIPAEGGAWTPITDGSAYDDKPRWAPDGRTLYFLSNRSGSWNLWARRFDPDRGEPRGDPFQVTDFSSSSQMVSPNLSRVQIAITARHLILPMVEASGAIWVLENVASR